MDDIGIADWGVAVAATIYVVQMFLNWSQKILERRNGKADKTISLEAAEIDRLRREYLRPVRNQVQDLHDWHNVNDSEGYPIWYVRPSLASTIAELSKNITLQTRILENIAQITQETLQEVRK